MQRELGEEGEPIDALLLIPAEFGGDRDRNPVVLDLLAVEQLDEEAALLVAAPPQLGAEADWIGRAGLERHELDERGEDGRGDEADVLLAVGHAAEHRNDEEDDVREDLDVEQSNEVCTVSSIQLDPTHE